MNRLVIFYILVLCVSISCLPTSSSSIASKDLLSIEDDPITADEFIYVYEKNNFNNDSIYLASDVEKYFDLFVKFKLKVRAAKDAGLDTTSAFIEEYTQYKDQLIQPYLLETQEKEKLVAEAYERMKTEINASHILISVTEEASADDTAKAYSKINELKSKLDDGGDFGSLAREFSDDPSAKSNNGELGYFTALQMVYAFENAAYSTPIDSISDIIRTKYGYHILKVHDRRPYSGQVKVSHIMIRTQNTSDQDRRSRDRAFEIHDQLVGGASWDELCIKYSDDARTKNRGGTLPFLSLRQINDVEFENAAFGLENPGDLSDPIRSKFGWHIIRLEEKKGLEPYEDMKENLQKRVSADSRTQISRKKVVERLKQEHSYREHEGVDSVLIQSADSSLLNGEWQPAFSETQKTRVGYWIGEDQFTIAQVSDGISKTQKKVSGMTPSEYMKQLFEEEVYTNLMIVEEQALIKQNRDFRMLINEYYEGILLFEIMNQEVWNKAVTDSLGLEHYFNDHRENYWWSRRVDATVIEANDKRILEDLKKQLDRPTYQLMKIKCDPGKASDPLFTAQIDSIYMLIKEYDDCVLEVGYPAKTDISRFNPIRDQLMHKGIKPEEMLFVPQSTLENKLELTLNSKSKKSLEYLYNQESALNLKIESGKYQQGENTILDSITWKKGRFELEDQGKYYLIEVNKVLDEQPKKLDEIQGQVISDYQHHLEEEWLKELSSKYEIEINETTFDKVKSFFDKKLSIAS